MARQKGRALKQLFRRASRDLDALSDALFQSERARARKKARARDDDDDDDNEDDDEDEDEE